MVSWHNMSKEKEWGATGIKKLKEMNEACLMKFVWGLYQNKSELWSKVLMQNTVGREVSGEKLKLGRQIPIFGRLFVVFGRNVEKGLAGVLEMAKLFSFGMTNGSKF